MGRLIRLVGMVGVVGMVGMAGSGLELNGYSEKKIFLVVLFADK